MSDLIVASRSSELKVTIQEVITTSDAGRTGKTERKDSPIPETSVRLRDDKNTDKKHLDPRKQLFKPFNYGKHRTITLELRFDEDALSGPTWCSAVRHSMITFGWSKKNPLYFPKVLNLWNQILSQAPEECKSQMLWLCNIIDHRVHNITDIIKRGNMVANVDQYQALIDKEINYIDNNLESMWSGIDLFMGLDNKKYDQSSVLFQRGFEIKPWANLIAENILLNEFAKAEGSYSPESELASKSRQLYHEDSKLYLFKLFRSVITTYEIIPILVLAVLSSFLNPGFTFNGEDKKSNIGIISSLLLLTGLTMAARVYHQSCLFYDISSKAVISILMKYGAIFCLISRVLACYSQGGQVEFTCSIDNKNTLSQTNNSDDNVKDSD